MSIDHLMPRNGLLPPAYRELLVSLVCKQPSDPIPYEGPDNEKHIPGIITFASGYGSRVAHDINWQAIGHYFSDKYTAAARDRGYRAAAAQLRKQGVPLEVAYRIFFGKELPR